VTKKNEPAIPTGRLKRRKSHRASNDFTTKPPPIESMLNTGASLSTVRRDFSSGGAAVRGMSVSTSELSDR
jgi:hypothetical protein